MISTFEEMGLPDFICQSCKEMGLKKPTPVQENCIPPILNGNNCVAMSPTGSGKTAAFALPIISNLSKDPYGIYSLIISPTRELAEQISQQFRVFGKGMKIDVCTILGGMSFNDQARAIEKNPHIIVTTPGRILHHLKSPTKLFFENLQYLVLDEVDRLFNDGFWEEIEEILTFLPKNRQTLLFSATLKEDLPIKNILTKPLKFKKVYPNSIEGEYYYDENEYTFHWKPNLTQVPKIEHIKVPIFEDVREIYLIILIEKLLSKNDYNQLMIFCLTCEIAETITLILRHFSYKTAVLHSKMEQSERLHSIKDFKAGTQRILVSTDVAARGLDIPFVDYVIHYNPPIDPTTYIHRAGRTGRAGREGQSIIFFSNKEKKLIENIENIINNQFLINQIETKETVIKLKEVLWAKRDAKITMKKNSFGEREEMLKLLDKLQKN